MFHSRVISRLPPAEGISLKPLVSTYRGRSNQPLRTFTRQHSPRWSACSSCEVRYSCLTQSSSHIGSDTKGKEAWYGSSSSICVIQRSWIRQGVYTSEISQTNDLWRQKADLSIDQADWKEGFKKKQVGVSDMTLLSTISNESINENLKRRFVFSTHLLLTSLT